MLSVLLPTFLSLAGSSMASTLPFGVFQVGGSERLLGSSFGAFATPASFDYVIIGGGTAGLTLADRLTANGSFTVAVIEAGSFYEISNSNASQIPAFDFFSTSSATTGFNTLVDWGVVTTPQSQLLDRTIHYAQGKCWGGGSSRNFMAYQRGPVGTYQQWANIVGDQSWIFSKILPYFQKSVIFTPPDLAKRRGGGAVFYDPAAFSPTGAPLHVSYTNYWAPIADFLRNAFISLGLKDIPGFNSGALIGYSEFTFSIDPSSATRSSSETAFLQESILRPNLMLYPQSFANNILFDDNKNAIGVNLSTGGIPFTLSASKEVILSAGVFRSPQVLMLSGIGPKETLDSFNISIISDLAGVGQNMHDQPFYGVTVNVNVTTQSSLFNNQTFATQAAAEFLGNRSGPLTYPGNSVAAFEKVPTALRNTLSNATLAELANFPVDWPELEILPIPTTFVETTDDSQYMEVNIAVLTTSSRGNVTIKSLSAQDNPIVSPNWLFTAADQEVAIAGLKRAREIIAATGISVGLEFSPGPSVQTDAEILNYIRETLAPVHHACGTNSMGSSSNPAAVVNTQGRVFGVNKLRVIDASIFPLLPPGHIQSSVYMVAEKLADNILSS